MRRGSTERRAHFLNVLRVQCLDFLKQFYADCPCGKHTVQTVNTIVFASLELGEVASTGILQDFISTIGRHPCNTATYGL